MLLDVLGKRVERALDLLAIALARCRNAKSRKEGTAECVGRKQAMQITAVDASVRGHRAFALIVDASEGAATVSPLRASDVDLVGVDRLYRVRVHGYHPAKALFGSHDGRDLEQAEAFGSAGWPLDAVGIGDALAQ